MTGSRLPSAVVTDLDGTLIFDGGAISPKNREALVRLGELEVPRIVATGRSRYSLEHTLPEDAPVDYVIYSSGLAWIDWSTREQTILGQLEPGEVDLLARVWRRLRLSFMIHAPAPDNHHMVYERGVRETPDFARRLAHYERFATDVKEAGAFPAPASQGLAIVDREVADSTFEVVCAALPGLSTIRTTSPLDGESTWIEVFPEHVSKSLTSMRLMDELGIDPDHAVVIGNDYNDEDLLAAFPTAFVVAEAPGDLRDRHRIVGSARDDGFAEAVAIVLSESS